MLILKITVVIFLARSGKETSAQNEESGHIRFFSFSLIEGYISLVMDEQTTRRSDTPIFIMSL